MDMQDLLSLLEFGKVPEHQTMHQLLASLCTGRLLLSWPATHAHVQREGCLCSRLAIGLHGAWLEGWYAIARIEQGQGGQKAARFVEGDRTIGRSWQGSWHLW